GGGGGGDLCGYVAGRGPGPRPPLAGEALDEALRAIGDLADLKSPWFTGHSRAAGELAAAAAERSGLPRGEVELVRRAGYVQELGRLGVPTSVWERPGPLSAS